MNNNWKFDVSHNESEFLNWIPLFWLLLNEFEELEHSTFSVLKDPSYS